MAHMMGRYRFNFPLRSTLEKSMDLFLGDRRKIVWKFRYGFPCLKIVKKRLDGHAGTAEHRLTAENLL